MSEILGNGEAEARQSEKRTCEESLPKAILRHFRRHRQASAKVKSRGERDAEKWWEGGEGRTSRQHRGFGSSLAPPRRLEWALIAIVSQYGGQFRLSTHRKPRRLLRRAVGSGLDGLEGRRWRRHLKKQQHARSPRARAGTPMGAPKSASFAPPVTYHKLLRELSEFVSGHSLFHQHLYRFQSIVTENATEAVITITPQIPVQRHTALSKQHVRHLHHHHAPRFALATPSTQTTSCRPAARSEETSSHGPLSCRFSTYRSVSLFVNPFLLIIFICFRKVDLPESPVPKKRRGKIHTRRHASADRFFLDA